jgi:hypothetical protein
MRKPTPKPGNEREDSGRRTLQNVIALCVVVALLLGGLWLYGAIRTYLKIEACVEAGLRDCDATMKDSTD